MVSREAILELKKDFKIVSKYSKYWLVILASVGLTVFYNSMTFGIEKEIISLTQQKSYLLAENMQLKKEKAVLSSPDRIHNIAKEKLKMKKVDYRNVYFINYE